MDSSAKRVMVVDDDEAQLDLASEILEFLGYNVVAAKGGEMAIQYLSKKRVDLLLLDMQMDPGINGRQTYEAALRLNPLQKAIIVSGCDDSDELNKTLALGALGVVKKPYTVAELSKGVQRGLGV